MAFLIVTVFGVLFYAVRSTKSKLLYALLGGGVGALSVVSLVAICHYLLGLPMTFLLDFILAIIGGIITYLIGRMVIKKRP